jgi:hypothetical protein
VSEYMEDIANYNMKHIEKLDYWKDYKSWAGMKII